MQTTTPPEKYRLDIDGLRAIAVLLVLIFHFSLVPRVTAGFIGVDVFFVISGFLITGILKRQLDGTVFGFAAFYLARIRRLAPALVAMLVATYCAGLYFLFPHDLRELANQLLVSQAYVANVYFWRTVNYFGLNGADVFLLHTWSLAVEEQFYLVYPVLLYLVHRLYPQKFWHGVALLLVVSFALNVYFVGKKPEAAFYLLPTRAWELLCGGLTGLAMAKSNVPRLGKQLLGLGGLVCIAAGALFYRPEYRFPGFFALIPVIGSSLVLFAHDARRTLASAFLEWVPLRYIGRISYPLYLVHWPIHVFASRVLGSDYGYGWHVAMFLLSMALAAVIYHMIEQPLRKGALLSRPRPMIASYVIALGVTALAVAVTKITDGLPHRFPPEVVRLADFVYDKTPPLVECEFSGRSDRVELARLCRIGNLSAVPHWIVFGDSHAWATHDAFDLWLKSRNEAAVFAFRHGCPPLADVHLFSDDGACFRFNQAILALVRQSDSIDSVALVSTWRQGRERLISTSERLQPSDMESRRLFARGFASEISLLIANGKRVYVWEPLPGALANVPIAMATALLRGVPANIDKSRKSYLLEYDYFFDDLAANRTRIAGVFSPASKLCSSGSCATSADGSPLYFDNAHPTRSSAIYFADVLSQGGPNSGPGASKGTDFLPEAEQAKEPSQQ